ncbi:helix-turn-helix domain-containing protein [uncultured Corynebacterium sp.]|uniref:helix-turn-helix domain-containing protein n=1 Tax=uncultured Corynebacterium sp. TaxID=159447 RepID=UPI0025DA2387|nr:helix-turn-helix domain-containing protein [uncultured Corynebacterium sp.]
MHTLNKNDLTPEQLNEISALAGAAEFPEVRELLNDLSESLRRGDDIIGTQNDEALTPAQASQHLGMSRTHLYKLLDRGDLPFHLVGSHRRILMSDIKAFNEQRGRDRIELAERFAQRHQNTVALDDEIADLL